MDVAASEFFKEEKKVYDLNFKVENNDGKQQVSAEGLTDVYRNFVEAAPMVHEPCQPC